jgi:V/A-type H+-transporting ATPase subunit A
MTSLSFKNKEEARSFFLKLTQITKDWNRVEFESSEFKELEAQVFKSVLEVSIHA